MVTGAGGSAAIGFCRSLRSAETDYEIIGLDCDKYHLCLADADFKYLIPKAESHEYIPFINYIAEQHRADFLHSQPDPEIEVLSENRERLSVRTNFPTKAEVNNCLDKFVSYKLWSQAGLTVPETMLLDDEGDLNQALRKLGPRIWIRNVKGAAGRDSLPTSDFNEAKAWIDFCRGWGRVTASKYLSDKTVTWQSFWNKGELVVAQSRLRKYWEFANRSPSGVTGLTGTGITIADDRVDQVALKCIQAISAGPNGIFSVDMTYDREDIPNPTEINIGRFFTTHYFFTKAGLNFPDIYVRMSLGMDVDPPSQRINPLAVDLAWVRGLDSLPVLTNVKEIKKHAERLEEMRRKIFE